MTGDHLRILLLGDYPADPRLGSAKVYYKLREELTSLGHECDVMLQPDIGEWPRAPRARWALAPILAATAVMRRGVPYDVIDVASAEGAMLGVRRSLGSGAQTAIVSRSHGLEHRNYENLLRDHSAGLTRKGWHRRWWYPMVRLSQVAMAARLADRMIVLNAGDAEFATTRHWKPVEAVDIVPHGVSAGFLAATPAAEVRRGNGILFCGTWVAMKGVRDLATAFSDLVTAKPSARLTVLGPGVRDGIVLADFAPHARAAVTVIPRVNEEKVMHHYRAHDMLVMSSTYEGFGMVVLEAMSQRLPVISTPVGCAPLLVRDGETGLVVAPRAPSELTMAMGRLLDDPGLGRRLAENAYVLATKHTWARTAERTVGVYRRAIASRRSVL
jgi:glycosyltransferase involved in cell wall biosynthesis